MFTDISLHTPQVGHHARRTRTAHRGSTVRIAQQRGPFGPLSTRQQQGQLTRAPRWFTLLEDECGSSESDAG